MPALVNSRDESAFGINDALSTRVWSRASKNCKKASLDIGSSEKRDLEETFKRRHSLDEPEFGGGAHGAAGAQRSAACKAQHPLMVIGA